MRTVVLLRHGQAASVGTDGTDSGRALTAEGEAQARAVGRGLAGLGLRFDAGWHSPYLRAQQTFEHVRQSVDIKRVTEDADLTPEGSATDVAQKIFEAKDRTLLVVSHLPLLPSVASILLGSTNINLQTGGCIKLYVTGGQRASRSCVLDALIPADVFQLATSTS